MTGRLEDDGTILHLSRQIQFKSLWCNGLQTSKKDADRIFALRRREDYL